MQTKSQRIDVGDSQDVGDQGTSGRPTARPDRNALLLGEVDEVPNNQDVADKSGLLQDPQLVIKAMPKIWIARGALAVALPQAPFA